MSNARKLQAEIDKVLKKVDEGVELFDEIWEKVYCAEQQSQKEKYEVDLKKEIKKLQRLRDQIKTWIGSSEVKDKDAITEARKLIETKMEQFKVCEKETKTKTYSKEGLARADRLSPEEQAKEDTCAWISDVVSQLQQFVDDRDVEIEKLSAAKSKKSNKSEIEAHQDVMRRHKFHINKLEGIMRLIMNDRLEPDLVNELKEDLEYYIEANGEEEFLQSYDEDAFYDSLGLDEMDMLNVDRVAQAPGAIKTSKSDDASSNSDDKEKKTKKAPAVASAVPVAVVGRPKLTTATSTLSNSGSVTKSEPAKDVGISTPKKVTALSSNGSNPPMISLNTPAISQGTTGTSSASVLTPNTDSIQPPSSNPTPPNLRAPPVTAAAVVNSGTSMAAVLKRDTEQQEKERQKQAALQQAAQQQQRLLQEQQARAQAEQMRLQQLQRQQQEQIRQQELLRQQQAALAAAQVEAQQKAQQVALQQRQQQQMQEQRQQAAIQQDTKQSQLQAQQAAQSSQQALQQQRSRQISSSTVQGGAALDALLTSGLGGLSLGGVDHPSMSQSISVSPQQQSVSAAVGTPTSSSPYDASASYLSALHESYRHCPSTADSERQKSYIPRNPYPTPSTYPTAPSSAFDNPVIFEKLNTDTLFFIFYYSQGTYQQYLAARELKKQSWRYHKKYMTWFQRHEEPKITTEEYEQGTYVYFDYETGWCQRIKQDFRFEYAFLEDSLSI